MWWFVFLLGVPLVHAATIPNSISQWSFYDDYILVDHSIDNSPYYSLSYPSGSLYYSSRWERPFSTPGEIIANLPFGNVVNAAGKAWNANNLLAGAQFVCTEYGGFFNDYIRRLGAADETSVVDVLCDSIQSSDIDGVCSTMLESSYPFSEIGDGSVSIIPIRCRDTDDIYYPNYSSYTSNFSEFYPMIVEAEKDAMDAMGVFNPYDPCDESTSRRMNNILFALMDWLGPSVGASLSTGEFEPYSVCGILRYILSLDTVDYILGEITVLKYPAADILEYLHNFNPCKLSQLGIDGLEHVRIIKDLLVEYSDLSETRFCDFLSNTQSREEYLQRGEIMITNIAVTLASEARCNNVMAIIERLDEDGIHAQYIGYNLGIESERNEFCRLSAEAFSLSSSYVPSPYKLPPGVRIEYLQAQLFQSPGEYLPGLTIIDLLNIGGAIYRSPKIIDGFGVLCTVFENFMSKAYAPSFVGIGGICTAIKYSDTKSIEHLCLTLSVTSTYSSQHPIGLTPIDPISIFLYGIRQLTGINDINKNEICRAADETFNELSLKDVVESFMDLFITETLPSFHKLCQNWEEIWCYWRPYCPVPTEVLPDDLVTRSSSVYHYWDMIYEVPSPEEVETVHSQFNNEMSASVAFVLGVTGYDSKDDLCDFAAETIDPLSGRANRDLAKRLRSNIIELFTDVTRCSELIDTMKEFLPEESLQYLLTYGNTNIIYQYTGFYTSQSFCEYLARSFDTIEGTESMEPVQDMISNGKRVNKFDVFEKMADYAKRVARSVRSV